MQERINSVPWEIRLSMGIGACRDESTFGGMRFTYDRFICSQRTKKMIYQCSIHFMLKLIMSKYVNTMECTRYVRMTYPEWKQLLEQIKIGCKFQVSLHSSNAICYISSVPINIKYHDDEQYRYYLVSNDDRRKIVKFLKQKNYLPM